LFFPLPSAQVALFIHQGLAAADFSSISAGHHLLVVFNGGPDDRLALSLAAQLCSGNSGVSATIIRLVKSEDASSSSDLGHVKSVELSEDDHELKVHAIAMNKNQLTVGRNSVRLLPFLFVSHCSMIVLTLQCPLHLIFCRPRS
jgi:hypothetical protein